MGEHIIDISYYGNRLVKNEISYQDLCPTMSHMST